jgi:hypothetical protein
MEIKSHFLPIRNIEVSLEDVRMIARRLVEAVEENANHRVTTLKKPENWTEDQFKQEVAGLRQRAFRVTVTVAGQNGERLFGDAPEILSSPNLPSTITSIFLTNNTAHEGEFKFRAPEFFSLLFDFSKPSLLDGENPVSAATPNNSNLTIEATQDAWIGNILRKVETALETKKVGRFGLHRGFVYDFLLWFFWLPLTVYVCFRVSPLISSAVGEFNVVLESIAYIWIITALIWVFRILFGYTKWAFPTVELSENSNRTKQHRRFWYAIVVGVIASFIADLAF